MRILERTRFSFVSSTTVSVLARNPLGSQRGDNAANTNVMEILARERGGIIQTWVFCMRTTQ